MKRLILISGTMGSGKTTVTRALQEERQRAEDSAPTPTLS